LEAAANKTQHLFSHGNAPDASLLGCDTEWLVMFGRTVRVAGCLTLKTCTTILQNVENCKPKTISQTTRPASSIDHILEKKKGNSK
jgi:hypothetical protein